MWRARPQGGVSLELLRVPQIPLQIFFAVIHWHDWARVNQTSQEGAETSQEGGEASQVGGG